MTRVKICCIASIEEMQMAAAQGVSAVGLVSEMPSGPGVIALERIAEIAARTPPTVASVLLTSRQETGTIVAQQKQARVRALQIVDSLPPAAYGVLRENLPGIALIQVIHVAGQASVDEAVIVAPLVDALLLDSGNPALAVKELGGTGRVHDWGVSRQIRDLAGVPIFLAGGLNADNVAAAIAQVQPFGVDVCSGVRTNGALDAAKLIRFCRAVQSADMR